MLGGGGAGLEVGRPKPKPRLSGFLRSYGNVSFKYDIEETRRGTKTKIGATSISIKPKTSSIETWKELEVLLAANAKTDENGFKSLMRKLRGHVIDIVGSELKQSEVDDACLSFFKDLVGLRHPSLELMKRYKVVYGSVGPAQIEKLHRTIREVKSTVPDLDLEQLFSITPDNDEYFGSKIKLSFNPQLPNESELSYLKNLLDKSKKPDPLGKDITLSYDVLEAQNRERKSAEQTFYGDELPMGGMSHMEFAVTIMEKLGTDKSSEELQTELFDLCGFDRFDMIGAILEKRKQLVKSFKDNLNVMKSEMALAAASQMAAQAMVATPIVPGQVSIHSEEELNIMKQIRKEEKKLNKELRMKRQEALASAMNRPLLKDREEAREMAGPEVNYPYVFDSLAKAKMSSGYIQGTKMNLPAGFERTDNKKYEEVTVPASTKTDVNSIGPAKLRPISSLDEIGQLAFKGMKSLNRIQSIVYNSAYTTSENMLVCAPTGAGKTNVAMLCIVQAIKQHIENGVIKKDKFKIVYVAPMKALAAEMAEGFGKRLAPLGLTVRELTGDMQLTKMEITQTQMIITTPEKWDVVTRKTGDVALVQLVRLLIIDEVHLLHGDRGPVVESIVARTLRQVESSQTVIRVVGLSATLPNYLDVAKFLRVNPYTGLFFFDGRFRPVPLGQTFIGVKAVNAGRQRQDMDEICYDKVLEMVKQGHQVMIFVHARNATGKTALTMKEMAQLNGESGFFEPDAGNSNEMKQAKVVMQRSRNRQLQELFPAGFGIHHAGILRSDRNLVEKYFSQGLIKVLCCTATLAWGVNLPAHAVIIKGTEIYDAKHGSFVDVGILDVLQIFGRAGRPQFDKSGHGTIITSHDKLAHYLSLLTNQFPIESNFIGHMTDNLNAEISLGTVTNMVEAVTWLSYSFLFVRMRRNPQVYGIKYQELKDDPTLESKRREIVTDAARRLDKARMIRFDESNGYFSSTDLGRTASHFYIKYDTVEIFNEIMTNCMNEGEILAMISQAQEFEQLKVREDEMDELEDAVHDNCELPVRGGKENVHGKVNILLQTHISRGRMHSFSLISDMTYINQNASRIARALFEIVLHKNLPLLSGRMLRFAKTIEKQMWDFEHPLKQHPLLKPELAAKLENRNVTLERLREMEPSEIGHLIHHVSMGNFIKRSAEEIPLLDIEVGIQPITRTVLRVRLMVTANFRWNDKVHGKTSEPFYIWVEDPESDHMYHNEYFMITRKQVMTKEPQEICFTIPIFEPLPTQYYVRAISDRWIGSETTSAISFQHLILPERHPPHTDLLDLQPLPVSALKNPLFEKMYKFSHFNPIQTQVFHTLYHSDSNVLLGAPTGSGKTIAAELAMMRVFKSDNQNAKVVYIAPLKALVRERINDWRIKLAPIGKEVVELTGDVTPDAKAIARANVIITTPEKWDGVSRSWQTRNFVRNVSLIVIDEIHLLGEDRGPVLEVIVSRTNFISSHTEQNIRIIGLSTALANAKDLANWLGIGQMGLFNFRPSVRPVPLECHIAGFPGKHYCPRMGTMNKPAFQAIKQHSPTKPSLIFVSSRRQTRITALDLIAFLAGEENPKQWLHMPEQDIDAICATIKDQNLKLTLAFGIGIHHAGLVERDRKTVEELYISMKIQVMIATATVAWGVNFPTHLVIVKGTEFYDGKLKRYVDMPITDVLQMIGRAGRPQYDDQGVAVVLVHDVKKGFYKKFLYEPFPVESSLLGVLADHLNAEIVAGTITTRQDAIEYMTWTYFFRRLVQNPSYYGMEGLEAEDVNSFLTGIVGKCLDELEMSYCIESDEDGRTIYSTVLGRIASYYYLAHQTVQHFQDNLSPNMSTADAIQMLVDASEFETLPVRHNEDILNTELAKSCPNEVNQYTMDSPHTKANLLLQAHMSRAQLPCTDYLTDTKSVMDNAMRVIQAMIDVCAEQGWLAATLRIITLLQQIVQARWDTDNGFLVLPHIEPHMVYIFSQLQASCIPELLYSLKGEYEKLAKVLRAELDEQEIEDVWAALRRMPILDVQISIQGQEIMKGKEPPRDSNKWIHVKTGTEVSIDLTLKRLNKPGREGTKVFAPKYPKPKDEGWMILIGERENKEMCALKRLSSIRGATRHSLTIVPERPGRCIYTVYVMSDSYLGLDQQYDLYLEAEGEYVNEEDEIYYSDEEMPEIRDNTVASAITGSRVDDDFDNTSSTHKYLDWSEEVEDHIASWE